MRKCLIAGAILAVSLIDPPQITEAGAFATEYTQLLNHAQLLMQYIRQAEQLKTAIDQLQDAVRNSRFTTRLTFGGIAQDIESLDRIVMGGQALAYSLGNLDALFAETFPGYKPPTQYFREYNKWATTALDTTRGVLRTAGLQSRQMATEQAVLTALRAQATSPEGRMQALQVLQQISEQQVQQLMKLRQLMIADLSSKQAYQAATVQKQAASEAATEKFFNWTPAVSDRITFQAGWK